MQNGKNAQVGWRSVLPLHRDRKPLFCGLQPVFRFAQLPTIGCWYLKKFDDIANIEGSLQSPQVQLTCPTIGAIQRWGRNGSPHGKHRRLLYRRHLWKHCHQKLSPEPEKLFHHVIWAILDHYLSRKIPFELGGSSLNMCPKKSRYVFRPPQKSKKCQLGKSASGA